MNYSISCFINEENRQEPNNKEITQSSYKFHSMVPKRHFLVSFFPRDVNKHKADSKSNQVSDQMERIWNDCNGTWDIPTNKLCCYEQKWYCNDNVQFAEVFGVILCRRWLVQKSVFRLHFFNYKFFGKSTSLNHELILFYKVSCSIPSII